VSDGRFGGEGRSIPAEMLPARLVSDGIEFQIGPTEDGQPNAVTCGGQTVDLTKTDDTRLYLLAAADEDVRGTFVIGNRPVEQAIQSWTGFIGQWDDRIWDEECKEVDYVCEGRVVGIKTGFIKRDPVAWFSTHRHRPTRGNEPYQFAYLYKYGFDIRPGESMVRLPGDARIKVLAITTARNENDAARAAGPLYDDIAGRRAVELRHTYPPPPVPVFQGVAAVGRVIMDRQSQFDNLSMGPPSAGDYADVATGKGVTFRYFDRDGELSPNSRAGAVGGALPRLNDGLSARNEDDTERCVWFDNEGRFFADLRASVPIDRINTYSWHRANRARQFFSLWGSSAQGMPHPDFRHGENDGWTLLAVVDTKELGEGGIHGSSVGPPEGQTALGTFRYLLWVAEDVGQGTFFTEIDVHATK